MGVTIRRVIWAVCGVVLATLVFGQFESPIHKHDETWSHWFHIAQFCWLAFLLGRAGMWRLQAAFFSGVTVVFCLEYWHLSIFVDNAVPLLGWFYTGTVAIAIAYLMSLRQAAEPSPWTIGQLWAAPASYLPFAILHWPPVAKPQLEYVDPGPRMIVGLLLLATSVWFFVKFWEKRNKLHLWAVIVPAFLLALVAFRAFKPMSDVLHAQLDLIVCLFIVYILWCVKSLKAVPPNPEN